MFLWSLSLHFQSHLTLGLFEVLGDTKVNEMCPCPKAAGCPVGMVGQWSINKKLQRNCFDSGPLVVLIALIYSVGHKMNWDSEALVAALGQTQRKATFLRKTTLWCRCPRKNIGCSVSQNKIIGVPPVSDLGSVLASWTPFPYKFIS